MKKTTPPTTEMEKLLKEALACYVSVWGDNPEDLAETREKALKLEGYVKSLQARNAVLEGENARMREALERLTMNRATQRIILPILGSLSPNS